MLRDDHSNRGDKPGGLISYLSAKVEVEPPQETDKARGSYIDSSLGRVTLGEYAEQWLAIQTFKQTTRQSTEQRLRSHVIPMLGSTPLARIKPSQIQA